ncbi:MAG: glycosyltransferase [Motilibacteraceae bacterium]
MDVRPFRARALVARATPVLHVNWPETPLSEPKPVKAALGVSKNLARLAAVRLRGGRVIWTGHNLRNHEGIHPRLERCYWFAFSHAVSDLVSLSSAGLPKLLDAHPRLRKAQAFTVPHMDYRSVLGSGDGDKRVYDFAMLGAMRAYKRPLDFLSSLQDLADENVEAVIAGSCPYEELRRDLMRLGSCDDRLTMLLEPVSDSTFEQLMRKSRVLVLPQDAALNSGSLLFALSCGTAVLAVDTPTNREISECVGGGWVQLFAPPLTSRVLERALASAPTSVAPDLSRYDIQSVGRSIAAMYEQVAIRAAARPRLRRRSRSSADVG